MMDTNMECDLQFLNDDVLDSTTHKPDKHFEKYITKVLTMCMQYNDISKIRALLRSVNTIVKAEMLMNFSSDVSTTINRMCDIYYCYTMKLEAGTTFEETTTGAMMRQLDELTTELRTTVPDRERIEDESRGFLRSELSTTGIHCQNCHDNCDYPVYPPRYRHHQRFVRDASSYRPSVPDRGISNINTPSPLSTIFGVQSCSVIHRRIQRVNRRHSHGKQHNGPSRYRVNLVMFGDRRGVARCDHRRKWYVNGHGKQEAFGEDYGQCAGADCDSISNVYYIH